MAGLVKADAENWGSGLSKQSCQSYYMLLSPDFQIMNIYNEKSLKENCNDWTLNRILPHIKPKKYSIIYKDFNAHHSWWNLDISNSIRTNELVQWLNQHQFELLNEPDISIFYRQNIRNILIIDLAFVAKVLN